MLTAALARTYALTVYCVDGRHAAHVWSTVDAEVYSSTPRPVAARAVWVSHASDRTPDRACAVEELTAPCVSALNPVASASGPVPRDWFAVRWLRRPARSTSRYRPPR